ncbi:MAG: hypothetical protein ACYC1Z_03800 [Georgenia sp.]
MNTDHDQQQHEPRRRSPEPETDRTTLESVEKTETPEAVQAARIAHRRGNNNERPAQDARWRARGVEWVRPTDLLARHGAALAGQGIDFEVELARRTRTATATGLRGLGDRARRLPPLSAFGHSAPQAGPSRPGVGLS